MAGSRSPARPGSFFHRRFLNVGWVNVFQPPFLHCLALPTTGTCFTPCVKYTNWQKHQLKVHAHASHNG